MPINFARLIYPQRAGRRQAELRKGQHVPARLPSMTQLVHPYTLPAATAVAAVATISACGIVTKARGDLPDWLFAPQISLVGCTGPQRIIFQVGLGLTASLLALNIATYVRAALPRFEQRLRWEVKAAAGLAFAGALGLAILGIIPLQRDCVALLEGRAPVRLDSMVHQAGASLFFLASWFHGIVSAHAYGRSLAGRVHEPAIVFVRRVRLGLVALPIVGLAALIPAVMLVPDSHARMQMGAGHQWLSVAAMIGLYLTYAVDIEVFTRQAPGSDDAGSASADSAPSRGAESTADPGDSALKGALLAAPPAASKRERKRTGDEQRTSTELQSLGVE